MHEFAIARSLVEVAESTARERGASRVVALHCRIGVVRQVDAGSLREAFEMAREGTIAADAALNVTQVGMELDCQQCGKHVELSSWGFACPACGSTDIRLHGGDALELTSVEMEVCDDDRDYKAAHSSEERASCGDESFAA
jgi:hydrogenase nickel incorporation protein HypA/HybF